MGLRAVHAERGAAAAVPAAAGGGPHDVRAGLGAASDAGADARRDAADAPREHVRRLGAGRRQRPGGRGLCATVSACGTSPATGSPATTRTTDRSRRGRRPATTTPGRTSTGTATTSSRRWTPTTCPASTSWRTHFGYFNDPDVAYVVAPQVYYRNAGSSWIARGADEQNFGFSAITQRGANRLGMPILIGSNHVCRSTALRSVGGSRATSSRTTSPGCGC